MKWTKAVLRIAVLRTVVAGATVLLLLLMVSAWTASYPRPAAEELRPGVWRGAFHVHTQASDGAGSIDDIVQAARAVGRSFVVVTDHNLETLAAPQIREGTLVVQAVELSTPMGHVVALGTNRGLNAQERREHPLTTVAALGGFSILAHPVQWKNPWKDWAAANPSAGLELYSADSFLRDALVHPFSQLIPALVAYPFHSGHALMTLVDDPAEARQRLLERTRNSPQIALCGVDAHGRPPYAQVFAAMALYVPQPLPTDSAEAQREMLLAAIRRGDAYCVFELLGDGQGFAIQWQGKDSSSRTAHVGETLAVTLPSFVPLPTQIRVYGSGALNADGKSVILTAPGAVHIEVWALAPGRLFRGEWKPWLVGSPIWVLPRIEPASTPQ